MTPKVLKFLKVLLEDTKAEEVAWFRDGDKYICPNYKQKYIECTLSHAYVRSLLSGRELNISFNMYSIREHANNYWGKKWNKQRVETLRKE